MTKWKIWVPVVVIVLFVGWYAFRPERLFLNHRVHQNFAAGQGDAAAEELASGTFHSLLHPTAGIATIYRLNDGSRILRLTHFSTSNGPDVHIYMVAENSANDNASVLRVGYIDLGTMKGNIGDQNYVLGPNVDLSKYRAVSVWCKRFSYNFGSAPLAPATTLSQK
jgi:hypothetical protein